MTIIDIQSDKRWMDAFCHRDYRHLFWVALNDRDDDAIIVVVSCQHIGYKLVLRTQNDNAWRFFGDDPPDNNDGIQYENEICKVLADSIMAIIIHQTFLILQYE